MKRIVWLIGISIVNTLYAAEVKQTFTLPTIAQLNQLSNIRHITFSRNNRVFVLASTPNADAIYSLDPATNGWKQIFSRPQKNYIQAIQALSDTDLLIINENFFLYWDMIRNKYPIGLSKENFNLGPNNMLLNVAGNSTEKLWVTYRNPNNTIQSRFFRIKDGKIQIKKENFNYKSISVGYDNITWAYSANNKGIIYKLEIDQAEDVKDTDIFPEKVATIYEKPFALGPIPTFTTLYAHDKNHLWALDASGIIYQFNQTEKRFISIDLPKIPQLGYIQLVSPPNGPLYCIHQSGNVYILPLDYISEKYPERLQPTIQKPEAEVPEMVQPVEQPEPIVERPESTVKPQGPLSQPKTLEQKTQESYARALARLGLIAKPQPQRSSRPTESPITTPSQPKIPQATTQPAAPLGGWERLQEERKDPIFDIGFNAGLIEGLRANPAYRDIVENLRAFYYQGIVEGPKTCILDNVASHIRDMLQQEGQQTLQSIQEILLKDFLEQKVRTVK